MIAPELTVVPARFNGPNRSGNGGWVSGLVGDRLARRTGAEVVSVSLRTPPPLETALAWGDERERTTLTHEDRLVAEASAGAFEQDEAVAPVTVHQAEQAREAYEGYHDHPFPRCFTCGSDRAEGDGLRVFSGPVGDGRMACTWAPHAAFCTDGVLDVPSLWAALDCPGGWAAGIKAAPMVLGRMTVSHGEPPHEGEACVAVGGLRDVQGRKHLTATALYGADGRLVGRSEQVWITIDHAAFS